MKKNLKDSNVRSGETRKEFVTGARVMGMVVVTEVVADGSSKLERRGWTLAVQ